MVKNNGSKPIRSGALAKAAGVSPDTIRHYERIGVLPPVSRTESGYRMYPANALERVLIVRRALGIGFTLAELADVLKSRDAGGAPCRHVHQLAQEKLKRIKVEIDALKTTERYLRNVLVDWGRRIQAADPGQKSHLLHSLADSSKKSTSATNNFRRQRKA